MTLIPPRIGIDYLPHQAEGVRWMMGREDDRLCCGGILADDMGLGKTFQTIGLLKNGRSLRTLIVCPPALIAGWTSELRACGYRVAEAGCYSIAAGGPNTVWLTTYPKVGLYSTAIAAAAFQRVVLDEGHCIRNQGTARWSHCMAISASALCRWILSATPVQNGARDWKALCAWLRIDSETDSSRISDQIMLRRTMEQLRPDIASLPPPPRFISHSLLIPRGKESTLLHALCDQVEPSASALLKIELWMRIQQFIVHPQIYVEGMRVKTGLPRPDWNGGCTKWTACMAELSRAVDEKVPTIVFCQFRTEIEMVCAAAVGMGADVFLVPQVDAAAAAAAAGRPVVVVVQIVAGGAGLNLQFCRRVLFLSQHWNPAVVHQAVGRAVRIGQRAVVEIHLFRIVDEVVDNLDLRMCAAHGAKIEEARRVCPSLYQGFYVD